jgi:hypothetical protein
MGIRDLMTEIEKFYSGKKDQQLHYPGTFILRPKDVNQASGEVFSPQLEREHSTLQNMKFLHFFPLLWKNFALLDPDTA